MTIELPSFFELMRYELFPKEPEINFSNLISLFSKMVMKIEVQGILFFAWWSLFFPLSEAQVLIPLLY